MSQEELDKSAKHNLSLVANLETSFRCSAINSDFLVWSAK